MGPGCVGQGSEADSSLADIVHRVSGPKPRIADLLLFSKRQPSRSNLTSAAGLPYGSVMASVEIDKTQSGLFSATWPRLRSSGLKLNALPPICSPRDSVCIAVHGLANSQRRSEAGERSYNV
jgi:hypothetical protein